MNLDQAPCKNLFASSHKSNFFSYQNDVQTSGNVTLMICSLMAFPNYACNSVALFVAIENITFNLTLNIRA